MSDLVAGKRRDANADGDLVLGPGEYGKDVNGRWYAFPPDENMAVGNLGNHEVVEHEDGTITVSPSILIERWNGHSWHGFLERGIWRTV